MSTSSLDLNMNFLQKKDFAYKFKFENQRLEAD